jgi:hypothetical protein
MLAMNRIECFTAFVKKKTDYCIILQKELELVDCNKEATMAEADKKGKKTPVENFGDMFESFGAALGQIFNDPELKAKAKDFGHSAAESARTFAGRFKDEEVKAKFRDVGKAAEDFGRSVADSFKSDKDKSK